MKLSKRGNRGGTLALNMTPMIDCVFLLLIFFMTCTQVSAVNKMQKELPQYKGTDDQSEATITVNINEEGALQVSGASVTLPQLAAIVADTIAEKGKDPSRVKVALRISRRANSKSFNQIIGVLQRQGIKGISTHVEKPQ